MNRLQATDLIVFVLNFLVVAINGIYIYRKKISTYQFAGIFSRRLFNLVAKYLSPTLKF